MLLPVLIKYESGDIMEISHKFYNCSHCGNTAVLVVNKGVPLVCCGEKMSELVPNTVEASTEKHLPAVTLSGSSLSVQVGSVPHPMEDEHHISFVYVETENGGQRKRFNKGAQPKCIFSFTDDKPVAVYAFCNLHGLWITVI